MHIIVLIMFKCKFDCLSLRICPLAFNIDFDATIGIVDVSRSCFMIESKR